MFYGISRLLIVFNGDFILCSTCMYLFSCFFFKLFYIIIKAESALDIPILNTNITAQGEIKKLDCAISLQAYIKFFYV